MPFDAEFQTVTINELKAPALSYLDLVKAQQNITANLYGSMPPPMMVEPGGSVQGCTCSSCERTRIEMRKPLSPSVKARDIALLKAARERINRGWCRGAVVYGNKVCAMGALLFAMRGGDTTFAGVAMGEEAELNRLANYLPGMGHIGALVSFNDSPGRRKEEVLNLFDVGIARLERGALEPPRYPGPTRINSAAWTGIDL